MVRPLFGLHLLLLMLNSPGSHLDILNAHIKTCDLESGTTACDNVKLMLLPSLQQVSSSLHEQRHFLVILPPTLRQCHCLSHNQSFHYDSVFTQAHMLPCLHK